MTKELSDLIWKLGGAEEKGGGGDMGLGCFFFCLDGFSERVCYA